MRVLQKTEKGAVVMEIDCTARSGNNLYMICRYGRYEGLDTVIEISDLSSSEREQMENELFQTGYLDISEYNWRVYEQFLGVIQDWLNIK